MNFKEMWKAWKKQPMDSYVNESLTVHVDGMNALVIIDGKGVHTPREAVTKARERYYAAAVDGARIMIEALKTDELMPGDINKVNAATEAIRRHREPMTSPVSICDMRGD